jgi:hypothetical protein
MAALGPVIGSRIATACVAEFGPSALGPSEVGVFDPDW